MDKSLWRDVLCSISSFCCISSSDYFGLEPVWKNYRTIKEILTLLKPTVQWIVHTNLASDDVASKALGQLVKFINEWRDLFGNWNPLASRVHHALRSELLTIRIRIAVLEVARLLKDSCQCLPAELSLPSFEHFIPKENSRECDFISTMIREAIQKPPERLGKVARCLGFRSNLDIFIEIVALEKLKNASQSEISIEVDYIEQLIALFMRIHDHLFMLKQSHCGVLVPDDFRCPLCLDLMVDPVVVASGQTYERAYIRKWFDMGLTVCPKTRQALHHTNMIPNYTCKALIVNWCEMKNMKLPDPMSSINEPFDLFCGCGILDPKGEVEQSVENLNSDSADIQREATAELLLFAKQNMENRILIADYGGIRLLVNLLHSIDPEIQQNAVTTLLCLATNHDNKIAISNSDAIGPLIHVLQTGTPEVQEDSAATFFCLSVIQENKSRIGRCGAIGPLVQLLMKGTPQGRNNAIMALFNLSIAHENRARIARAGGVKLLVELIKDPVAGMVEKAVALLESISRSPEGRSATTKAGGIPALVQIVELGSAREKENAAAALLRLCVSSVGACRIALLEGSEPPLVAMALSGTPRAREKALALLRQLRSLR